MTIRTQGRRRGSLSKLTKVGRLTKQVTVKYPTPCSKTDVQSEDVCDLKTPFRRRPRIVRIKVKRSKDMAGGRLNQHGRERWVNSPYYKQKTRELSCGRTDSCLSSWGQILRYCGRRRLEALSMQGQRRQSSTSTHQ